MKLMSRKGPEFITTLTVVPRGLLRWKRRISGFFKMVKWLFSLSIVAIVVHYLMKAANIFMDCETEFMKTYKRLKERYACKKQISVTDIETDTPLNKAVCKAET